MDPWTERAPTPVPPDATPLVGYSGSSMGAGTGWAGWANAHPGNNLDGHCPP